MATKVERLLARYRELLKEHISNEEVRLALEMPVKVNMMNIHDYSTYFQGARMAFVRVIEFLLPYVTAKDRPYMEAMFKLISKDIRHTALWISGQEIAFRNFERKGKKLVSVEAYFVERRVVNIEVKP